MVSCCECGGWFASQMHIVHMLKKTDTATTHLHGAEHVSWKYWGPSLLYPLSWSPLKTRLKDFQGTCSYALHAHF